MQLSIEKNIPIPVPQNRKRSPIQVCLQQLEIGESFLIPVPHGTMAKVSGNIGTHAKRVGKKFTLRTLEEGVRVWRVA